MPSRKADPGATKRCGGVLLLEQIQGMLLTDDTKRVNARCPECGWTGTVRVARAYRAGSGNVRCLAKPARSPAQHRATLLWQVSGAYSVLKSAEARVGPGCGVPEDEADCARKAIKSAMLQLQAADWWIGGFPRECPVTGESCRNFPACRKDKPCKDEWMNDAPKEDSDDA